MFRRNNGRRGANTREFNVNPILTCAEMLAPTTNDTVGVRVAEISPISESLLYSVLRKVVGGSDGRELDVSCDPM